MQRSVAVAALVVALTSVSTAALSAVSALSDADRRAAAPTGGRDGAGDHARRSSRAAPGTRPAGPPTYRARSSKPRNRRARTATRRPTDRRTAARRTSGAATVALAGDVQGEPPVRAVLARGANPLAGVARRLRAADLAMVNVETAVGARGEPTAKSFAFNAPATLWTALATAGVDVVSLANDHALDYGANGLADTIRGARRAGLSIVGAGRDPGAAYAPAILDAGGRTVAFVALSRVLPSPAWEAKPGRAGVASALNERLALASVRAAARASDRVVVSVHWGQELQGCPDAGQRALAAKLVTAGADVVVGHHPHVLQGVRRAGNALVGYSLGSFASGAGDRASRSTGVLTAGLRASGPVYYEFEPARIDRRGAPVALRANERQRRLEELAGQTPGSGRCPSRG